MSWYQVINDRVTIPLDTPCLAVESMAIVDMNDEAEQTVTNIPRVSEHSKYDPSISLHLPSSRFISLCACR